MTAAFLHGREDGYRGRVSSAMLISAEYRRGLEAGRCDRWFDDRRVQA